MRTLFLTGHAFGRTTLRYFPAMGVWMAVLGGLLVGLTMALGGRPQY